MTHADHLLRIVPDLFSRRILDVGSGRGAFIVDVAKRGAKATGIEPYDVYRDMTQQRAQEAGVTVDVREGVAEKMPFTGGSFDFVNMCEVLEHVEDPLLSMREVARVLSSTGLAYVSIPNRFGMKDQHFHLYFVNWMPRAWSDAFISRFGKHKEYTKNAGRQRLSEMHYYTYGGALQLMRGAGLSAEDARIKRIKKEMEYISVLILPLYYILRIFYFDSFHLLVRRSVDYV